MPSKPDVWINNEILPWEEAKVPILSHGLSRGSAVFEIFGTYAGPDGTYAFRMDRHLERLENTVRLLGMELAYSTDEIAEAVSVLARRCQLGRGIVKIMGYWGQETIRELVLDTKLDVAIFPIHADEKLGLDKDDPTKVCISRWRKLHPETIPVEAKACANYLSGYMIRKDAMDRGFDLGLCLGTDGLVAEGSVESVFIAEGQGFVTPPLGKILQSVTRDTLVRVAEDGGIPVRQANLTPDDLMAAPEMFTCHTGVRVCPVKQFEDKYLPAPGPLTQKVSQRMAEMFAFKHDRYAGWFTQLF